MGQHQEPTIAIVDAVAVVPDTNETLDIEQGNSGYRNDRQSYNETNQKTSQQYQHDTEPTRYSSGNDEIIVMRRVQPPTPTIVYGHLGRYECSMQCPFCEKMMITHTKTRCDGITWLFVLILFLVFWPLCWLPLCMPKCQRVHHYCSICQRKVGVTEPCS